MKCVKDQIVYLSDLAVGQSCVVLDVQNDDYAFCCRLFDMGIVKDAIIKVVRIAPFGDPVVIFLRGYNLCLRKIDMKKISVRVL